MSAPAPASVAPAPAPAWRAATLADAPAVLELLRAFYLEEGLVFEGREQGRALDVLLADPALGRVFVLEESGAGAPGRAAAPLGYLVLTRGHSLEFGGAFLLLDELYLAPRARGRGEGRRALDFAAAHAREVGARCLRLEVERANRRAREVYSAAGFRAETRDLLTLRLDSRCPS